MGPDGVRLNLRGKRFETTRSILAPSPYFSALLSDRWNFNETDEEIFIDRDPDYFGILLYMLRSGDLQVDKSSSTTSMDLLYKEAAFYGLEDTFAAAFRGLREDLEDGGRLLVRAVVVPCSMPESAMIRASPTGGFCIASGNTICSYDEWNIEEEHHNPLISITEGYVYDVLWRDSRNIIVSTKKHVGVFNSESGELSHWFSGSDQPDVDSCGKLCMNYSNEVFSSCTLKSTGKVSTMAVWDVETGKLKRSIIPALEGGFATRKLEWMGLINCLLAVHHTGKGLQITYIDVRLGDKEVCQIRVPTSFVDVVVDETNNTVCMIAVEPGVYFFDNRKFGSPGFGRAVGKTEGGSGIVAGYCHQGQIFARTRSKVLVLSNRSWVSTKVETGMPDSIKDVAVAGDRLFSLHSDPKVVKVWECPRRRLVES